MLTSWTTPFVEGKAEFVAWLSEQEDLTYETLLRRAIEIICERVEFGYGKAPDPDRIHAIDDGAYQGTLIFVVGASGYQPTHYWATQVSYGSCSGCDALVAALGYGESRNYQALYTLTLHMLQSMRPISEDTI